MPTHHHGAMREILGRMGLSKEERENMVIALDSLLNELVATKTKKLMERVDQLQNELDELKQTPFARAA